MRALQHCCSRNADAVKSDLVETVYGDIRNPDTCLSICRGVDGVIHLAALIHVDDSRKVPREYWDVNVGGTFNLLEGARLGGVKRFTYMSTAERFGSVAPPMADDQTPVNASSPYAASKYCAERYCVAYGLAYGMDLSIAIGFNVYGPRQRSGAKGAVVATFVDRALRGEDITIYGGGTQTRDYTYVRDLADGVARLHLSEKAKGETIILASGVERRILDITYAIFHLTGAKSRIVHVEGRPGENMRSCGNPDKAKRLLAWEADTPFQTGLAETIDYFKNLVKY